MKTSASRVILGAEKNKHDEGNFRIFRKHIFLKEAKYILSKLNLF